MRKFKLKRLLGFSLLSLMGLALIAFAGLYLWIRGSFPIHEGNLSLRGIAESVDVYRDEHGITHVYAKNREDLLFAQGFVHAQDRLEQMDISRRFSQGRLSEVFGQVTLESDRYVRNIGLNRTAETVLAHYKNKLPDTFRDLEHYSAGVNAYLAQSPSHTFSQKMVGLSGEWVFEPWTVYDSISYAIYMAWSFSSSWDGEYSSTQIVEELPVAVRQIAFPPNALNRPTVLNTSFDVSSSDQFFEHDRGSLLFEQSALLNPPPELFNLSSGFSIAGSNAWVVGGQHSVSGKPLLANDPHLWVTAPSYWYQMSLHSPEFNVTGFSMPGGPGILIGRNENIAWGITNALVDVQDVYIEKINPEDPNEYWFDDQWRKFKTITEVIKIAGESDHVLEVNESINGPLLTEVSEKLDHSISFKWDANVIPVETFKAILALNTAQDYKQFKQALKSWTSPALNFLYADMAGDIGYQLAANVPVRGFDSGRFAVPGWEAEYQWQGWLDYDDLPSSLNPDSGVIISANNAITVDHQPELFVTIPGLRAQRINDLLKKGIDSDQELDLDFFQTMQLDQYSLLAEQYIPDTLELDVQGSAAKAVQESLKAWDKQLRADSKDAAVFAAFTRNLVDGIYADEMSEALFELYLKKQTMAILTSLDQLHALPEHDLWDDKTTDYRETRADIVNKAFTVAVTELVAQSDDASSIPSWGQQHTLSIKSFPLGMSGIPALEKIVNHGEQEVGGSLMTLNANGWFMADYGQVSTIPSMRFLADMSDNNNTRGVHAIGQSGHPLHKNYRDMLQMWRDGSLLDMPLKIDDLKANFGHLRLNPDNS